MNQLRAKNGSLNSCRMYSLLQGNFSPEDREAYLKTAIWCLHGCGGLERGGSPGDQGGVAMISEPIKETWRLE